MRTRLLAKILAGGAVLAVVASCSAEQEGTPAPAVSSSPPPADNADNRNGAPKVENPIDARKYVSNPCLALSAEQSQRLGATKPGKPRTTGGIAEVSGPGCVWHNEEAISTFTLGFVTGNENGLADTYLGKKQGHWAYFEPTTVDGYPAVFSNIVDGRPMGDCTLAVGISQKLEFIAGAMSYKGEEDSCGAAREVASAALKTMNGGA